MKKTLNVIKVGGKIVEDKASLERLLNAFCKIKGDKMLVCGGGRTATKVSEALGIPTEMVGGRRVTDAETLKVVTMVYAGLVNKQVVASLQAKGVNAIGLTGADLDCIHSERRPVGKINYGYVGDISEVKASAFANLIELGIIPVICPITHNGKGMLLNTNADTIASAVASAMADLYDVTLTFCFEKNGVLSNPEDEDSVIPEIRKADFIRLRDEGIVSEGMLPKLENAFKAIDAGVNKIVITNADNLGKDSGTEII